MEGPRATRGAMIESMLAAVDLADRAGDPHARLQRRHAPGAWRSPEPCSLPQTNPRRAEDSFGGNLADKPDCAALCRDARHRAKRRTSPAGDARQWVPQPRWIATRSRWGCAGCRARCAAFEYETHVEVMRPGTNLGSVVCGPSVWLTTSRGSESRGWSRSLCSYQFHRSVPPRTANQVLATAGRRR